MINLYKGDNIDVLDRLINEKKKYNIVYLDPPYNTKNNSLTYKDNIGSSQKWIDYFKTRLVLIKNVLEEKSVIYVSIGHEEIANAKLTLDEVFGKKSFVAIMPRITNNVAKTTKTISRINDFLIIYKIGNVEFEGTSLDTTPYKLEDEHSKTRGKYFIRKLAYKDFSYSKTMDFEVVINGEKFYPKSKKTYLERKSGKFNSEDWCWLWSKRKMEFAIENDYIVKHNGELYKKTYTKCEIQKIDDNYSLKYGLRIKPYTSLELVDKKYSNINNKTNLEKLFSYPKSNNLLNFLFKLPKFEIKNILDPFAGTGVSAIIANNLGFNCDLIQISEEISEKSKLKKDGYNDIFDLTKNNLQQQNIEMEIHE